MQMTSVLVIDITDGLQLMSDYEQHSKFMPKGIIYPPQLLNYLFTTRLLIFITI